MQAVHRKDVLDAVRYAGETMAQSESQERTRLILLIELCVLDKQ